MSNHTRKCTKDKFKNVISIFHHNVQHLPSRIDLLEIFLNELKPDIVALTEHKMTDEELGILNVANYNTTSYFARKLGRGGGVIILVHKNLSYKTIIIPSVQSLLLEKVFEFSLSEILTSNCSFLLGCIYRTPDSSNLDQFFINLEILLDVLCKRYKNVIIAGDFNIDVLVKDNRYKKFVNILAIYGMKYMVNFATRVTENSKSAIDNFITNMEPSELKVTGVITHISDHDGQLLDILYKDCKSKNVTRKHVRKFNETNTKTFCTNLSSESWQEVYHSVVDLKYDVFYNIFKYHFDVSFPKVYVTEKPYKSNKWIDDDIKSKKAEIINLECQLRNTRNKSLKSLIKREKIVLKKNITKNKKKYFEDRILNSKNIIKATWNLVNSEVGKQSKSHTNNIKLLHEGHYITDPIAICETFNSFFVNAVENLVIPSIVSQPSFNYNFQNLNPTNSIFKFSTVTEQDIEKIVLSFGNKYSTGPDDIPITVIKAALHLIRAPLTHIVNHSLFSGFFPDTLKKARVIPVFKKGSPEDVTHFRQISLLPVFSKILEKAVFNQLSYYLESNKLLDNQQHGFRSNKSTITAGIEFIESIIDSIDKGDKVIGIFLDLSRAFDSVEHSKLASVLCSLGIQNIELAWFKSYLGNRNQFVELNYYKEGTKFRYKETVASQSLLVKHGVPQGSILGPLLFLCYLKGLPEIVEGTNKDLCLYADDTNVVVTGNSEQDIEISSHIGLSLIKDFLNSKNLLLNSSKSNFISFSTKQVRTKLRPTIFVDDDVLGQVQETKFLGLIIDEHLSWDQHVDLIMKKTSSGLYALRQMAKSCNSETLITIYYALIQSHIGYGISIYGATNKCNMDRILKQQKRALRIILNLKPIDSVKNFFSQLNIFTVYGLYIYETIKIVYLSDKILTGNNFHKYNTRSHRFVNKHKLEFFKKKTTFKGNTYFDCLPNFIKQEKNPKRFLNSLKIFLTQSAFYSIEEFSQQR